MTKLGNEEVDLGKSKDNLVCISIIKLNYYYFNYSYTKSLKLHRAGVLGL